MNKLNSTILEPCMGMFGVISTQSDTKHKAQSHRTRGRQWH